jgi:tRNA threonylcarbamoyl adenosine modification protein (Sua5/YciO/YrdC/YwlC family)
VKVLYSSSLKVQLMLLYIHPENPQSRNIKMVTDCLMDGGVIIYPTDTIYGLGCSILHPKAIERVCQIKQIDPRKAQLSFICHDISDLSLYTKSLSTPLYRMIKTHLPGPYTFILPASKQVPKLLKSKKDTVGLRIPDNKIACSIIQELTHPILSTSLPGEMVEEYTDPELMFEKFKNQVDIVVHGGIGGMIPSTIIDCTTEPPVLVRQGLGAWETVLA